MFYDRATFRGAATFIHHRNIRGAATSCHLTDIHGEATSYQLTDIRGAATFYPYHLIGLSSCFYSWKNPRLMLLKQFFIKKNSILRLLYTNQLNPAEARMFLTLGKKGGSIVLCSYYCMAKKALFERNVRFCSSRYRN